MSVSLSGVGLTHANGQVALSGIDIQVQSGERVALIGPSGAGKTSLLRLLASNLQPSSGQLSLLDQDPWQLGARQRQQLRAQLQDDILPGENWRQLWRKLLAALPPDEAAKVMVDALHVAARTDDLSGVERYLRRALRSGELTLTVLREHYGLDRPTSQYSPTTRSDIHQEIA